MIDIAVIATRLATEIATLRGHVEPSLDVAAMVEAPPARAKAYVAPTGDRGGPAEIVTGHDQRLSHTVLVLVGLPSRNDAGAGGAVAQLTTLRRDIRATLHGWQPAGWVAPLHYSGGRLVSVPRGGVWWGLTFTVDSYEE